MYNFDLMVWKYSFRKSDEWYVKRKAGRVAG